MSTDFDQDRWLLPRHQTEYPARALLPETTLHGRREATFLVLTALFFVPLTALITFGASRAIDLTARFAELAPSFELPVALVVPLGVVPFALALIAGALVAELLGRRRATALVLFGIVTSVALAGLMQVADLVDGGQAFPAATALGACAIAALLCHLLAFDLLRRLSPGRHLFARLVVASFLALGFGWAVFALVLRSGYVAEPVAADTVNALALGSAACSAACVLVLAIPAVLIARGLAVALRVGPSWFGDHAGVSDGSDLPELADDTHAPPGDEPAWVAQRPAFAEGSVARRLPQAEIVEDEHSVSDGVPHGVPHAMPRRARAMSIPPYSSAELQFFRDGDDEPLS